MKEIENKYKNKEGFLYLTFAEQESFGWWRFCDD